MTRRHRLIIWGPGDMGGRALRTALESPRFDVVGVKVFSPHKHGRDIGELAGLPPVGISATTSKAEILALEADCVVHTPTTPALVQGADADVLESGKNVVSAASYHNPAMPTWLYEIRDACRAGSATLHATGGFQSALAARLTRSLAAANREITRTELIEETDLPEGGVYPWNTVPDDALPGYFAGLRVLEAAAFPDVSPEPPVVHTEDSGAAHTLGERVGYRSIRTRGVGGVPPRYRLATTTPAGTATATVDFHPSERIHPADHLTPGGATEGGPAGPCERARHRAARSRHHPSDSGRPAAPVGRIEHANIRSREKGQVSRQCRRSSCSGRPGTPAA